MGGGGVPYWWQLPYNVTNILHIKSSGVIRVGRTTGLTFLYGIWSPLWGIIGGGDVILGGGGSVPYWGKWPCWKHIIFVLCAVSGGGGGGGGPVKLINNKSSGVIRVGRTTGLTFLYGIWSPLWGIIGGGDVILGGGGSVPYWGKWPCWKHIIFVLCAVSGGGGGGGGPVKLINNKSSGANRVVWATCLTFFSTVLFYHSC